MKELPRIWVDWNDFLDTDVVDLGFAETKSDFEKQGIALKEGVKIRLYGDDVEADAVIVRLQNGLFGGRIVEGTLINVEFP